MRSQRKLSLKLPPPALFGLRLVHASSGGSGSDSARLALGVPNVELRHAYTRAEQIMFDAPDVTEVRVPLLNVAF